MSVDEMTPVQLVEQYVAAVEVDLAAAVDKLHALQVQTLAAEDRVTTLRALRARHVAALASITPEPAPEPPTTTGILPTAAPVQPSFDDVMTGQVAS